MTNTKLNIWDEPGTLLGAESYAQKQHNWAVLRDYGNHINEELTNVIESWEKRFNAQLDKTSQPSEVKDARVAENKTYESLKDRLDDFAYWEDVESVELPYILLIKDLNGTSKGLHLISEKGSSLSTSVNDKPYVEVTTSSLLVSKV